MGPPQDVSSLVTIDSAVAKGITGFDEEAAFRDSSSLDSTANDKQQLSRKASSRRKDATGKTQPKSSTRARSNSLRHVKNSTELLRQQSKRVKPLDAVSESGSSVRGGRQFTVGNVGNNGMIYLRPVANGPATKPPPVTVLQPLQGDPGKAQAFALRDSVWSGSQLSTPPRKTSPPSSFPTGKIQTGSPGHQRARSASTVEDQRPVQTKDGVLKIVIDRTRSDRPKTTELGLPTLEVPIPSYRLGTPRFSVHGTAMLRSSVYTRTSVSDNRASSVLRPDFDTLFPHPPQQHAREGHDHSLLRPSRSETGTYYSGVTRSSAALPAPGMYSVREPIEPEIYDVLATCMDDPSVVRFSPKTGEITAATPPRIIAEIASKSFMDYELVSDFFLTFRAYLSCENVLNLLLARLKWAINRHQDDGRIIRIRTFAALRHWILNYFLDDFVPNRRLRGQFCNQINTMFRDVKARNDGGTSDLKILLDLKRCWNGRCSTFWDLDDMIMDAKQDDDILPGGTEDVQDAAVNCYPQKQTIDRNPAMAAASPSHEALHSGTWIDISDDQEVEISSHARNASEASAHNAPLSPISDYSIQPMSCSIPRTLKRTPPPRGEQPQGPRPVPLQTAKTQASTKPPQRPAGHAHKRSGSFADSLRGDRRSIEEPRKHPFEWTANSGSLIRGCQFPPGDAVVDVIAPLSPIAQLSSFDLTRIAAEDLHEAAMNAGGQGMNKFMGSIRRALSSKQGPNGPYRTGNASPPNPALRGKTSTLPLNVAYNNEAAREKSHSPVMRRHARIDLLCAEIHETYQGALCQAIPVSPVPTQEIGIASGNETQEPSLDQLPLDTNHDLRAPLSGITSGSRSIVIVDDTGHTMPTMSGALPLDSFLGIEPSVTEVDNTSVVKQLEINAGHDTTDASLDSYYFPAHVQKRRTTSFEKPRRSALRRSSSLGYGRRPFSVQSAASTLRRYASYQSSISRPAAKQSLDTVTSISASQEVTDDQPARQLRRRPGGDLRKFQNVHELEPGLRPQSMQSLDAATESAPGSMLLMSPIHRTEAQLPETVHEANPQKPVSMMRTHSSQKMRPSFEAVVKNFAEIPDDDDGGLEATLMKLEGRYEKRSPDLPSAEEPSQVPPRTPEFHLTPDHSPAEMCRPEEHNSRFASQSSPSVSQAYLKPELSPHARLRSSIARRMSPIFGLATVSVTGSDESYSSIPLLERGVRNNSEQGSTGIVSADLPRPLFSRHNTENAPEPPDSSHPSIEIVEETDSMKRIPRGSIMPDKVSHHESFLLDEDDRLSDLSSELSVDVIDYSEVEPRTISPLIAQPGTALSGLPMPSHPLTHPPTPPFTGLSIDPLAKPVTPVMYQQMPLTPDPSPTIDHQSNSLSSPREVKEIVQPYRTVTPLSHNLGHIAFILAYDSEILAQQFTLVEKAALSEIDWTDLVEMKWDNKSEALNWVDYLRQKEHRGIDLVTSRFNLMVKWVLSEIVMTQDIYERAKTLIKYIHVAAHARKMRNYATMVQIVIGLTATDCSRLRRTWELVSSAEKQILKEMELLVQPVRNFHALRTEMESQDILDGCIPFVGLYVHDLTYNAQKPAQIASTRDGEPLINFERYRTTATIVKNLLRLIDLSNKYDFRPVQGLVQRCLWIAALPDNRIRYLSQSLE